MLKQRALPLLIAWLIVCLRFPLEQTKFLCVIEKCWLFHHITRILVSYRMLGRKRLAVRGKFSDLKCKERGNKMWGRCNYSRREHMGKTLLSKSLVFSILRRIRNSSRSKRIINPLCDIFYMCFPTSTHPEFVCELKLLIIFTLTIKNLRRE